MKAADTAALRGHEVTLFEKRKLGGYLHEASYPDFKDDIRNALRYLTTQVKKRGIPVIEKAASPEDLEGFDAVIVAAGASPVALPVPGADQEFVQTAVDILNPEAKKPEGRIIVIGGGLIGTETAVELSLKQGNEVTVVEMLPEIMNGCSDCDHIVYSEMIKEHDINILTSARVLEIGDHCVVIEKNGRRRQLPADHVLVAAGMKPNNSIYEELKKQGRTVYNVGDSVKTGKIYDAIHMGYKAGLKV